MAEACWNLEWTESMQNKVTYFKLRVDVKGLWARAMKISTIDTVTHFHVWKFSFNFTIPIVKPPFNF